MRLWEVARTVRPHRRVSLHWTYRGAAIAALYMPHVAVRLRTLPKWTRPLHRLIRW